MWWNLELRHESIESVSWWTRERAAGHQGVEYGSQFRARIIVVERSSEARHLVNLSRTHGAVKHVDLGFQDVEDGTLELIPERSETFLEASDAPTVKPRASVASCELEAADVELVAQASVIWQQDAIVSSPLGCWRADGWQTVVVEGGGSSS
jgi:hypothetical protein